METIKRPVLQAVKAIAQRPAYQPVAPFLYPFLGQHRSASILANLSENKGHYNKRIRRGRGPASGKGKTSGRGHKGQGQHGKVPYGFNGGQTKDEVVAGKRGFENYFSVDLATVNLNRLQYWIDKGKLDPTKTITMKELNSSRCLHGVKDGVKLLAAGKDELRSKVNLVVSRASAEAIAAVERLGGTVTTRFYSEFAVKKVLAGEMDPIHSRQSNKQDQDGQPVKQDNTQYRFRLPDPIRRKDLEYYRDPAHRGYLMHTVKEGHSPSLYFKNPLLKQQPKKKLTTRSQANESKAVKKAETRMW